MNYDIIFNNFFYGFFISMIFKYFKNLIYIFFSGKFFVLIEIFLVQNVLILLFMFNYVYFIYRKIVRNRLFFKIYFKVIN